ncbi:hypothetical protein Dimus_035086 [Dionaea muscipula]
MGVEFSVVKISLLTCLFLFDNDEDYRLSLSLDGLWWRSRGLSIKPWSEGLVLIPRRVAWLRCFGIPLYARCPETFMAIGKRCGEVLRVEYDSLESDILEDGRISIITEALSPLFCSFTLMVEGLKFTWAAMDSPEKKHGSLDLGDLSPLDDDDKTTVSPSRHKASSQGSNFDTGEGIRAAISSEEGGVMIFPDSALCGGGFEAYMMLDSHPDDGDGAAVPPPRGSM